MDVTDILGIILSLGRDDLINAGFEAFGGLFILNHCRVLLAEKIVRGVSVVSVVFFTTWGMWNLYYYPSLGQVISTYGAVLIAIANCYWVALLVYYRLKPGGRHGNVLLEA